MCRGVTSDICYDKEMMVVNVTSSDGTSTASTQTILKGLSKPPELTSYDGSRDQLRDIAVGIITPSTDKLLFAADLAMLSLSPALGMLVGANSRLQERVGALALGTIHDVQAIAHGTPYERGRARVNLSLLALPVVLKGATALRAVSRGVISPSGVGFKSVGDKLVGLSKGGVEFAGKLGKFFMRPKQVDLYRAVKPQEIG